MKQKRIFVGKVSSLAFPNKGTVQTEEGDVVVKNVIPGQTVSFVLSKNRPGRKEGRLLEILERSPLEGRPGCICHADCGGCIYQTLPYEEELKLKEAQIRTLLEGFLKNHPDMAKEGWFQPILASPVCEGYRNKMEFSFGNEYKDGPIALGMHRFGRFNDIIDTPDCRIVSGDMRMIRQYCIDWARRLGLRFYRRQDNGGYLRHLLLRRGVRTGELLVALVTTSEDKPDLTEFTEGLLSLDLEGKITGIMHIVNDSVGDAVRDECHELLYGREHLFDEILGLRFRISPFSFFQTNTLGAEILYRTAADYVRLALGSPSGKAGTVFDLYSGTGTIAQVMAGSASKVVGIELVEEAVEAAKENARMNGIQNVEFLAGDVFAVMQEIPDHPDLIILDPPRDGVSPKALSKILSYGADHMIYISCKATSLVRDLQSIYDAGYSLVHAVPVDLFPQTANVETIALMSKVGD
ncbi:MAG: 23S rRNA (uracil(1939)-C(5))-methyltransferase RlmD [Lachnospiraceae bacterium]|nr:23S rRNA (uracil(1939)-C(5))-methyltransferase RlmD [Lachnospiraceae bacterium]